MQTTNPEPTSSLDAWDLDAGWLRAHGIEGEDNELGELSQNAYEQLSLRVGDHIADSLDDTQLAEFEALPETERVAWLDRVYPNYLRTVRQEIARLKEELQHSPTPKALLASWKFAD